MSSLVMVVDDNPINLKLAEELLSLEGYLVATASDAQDALSLLKSMNPDLILMDLAMPEMDGLTLTRHLKAQPQFQHIPIIALTASAMKGDDVRVRDAGCDGYITKPINTRTFFQTIASILAERRMLSTKP